jgi:ABC-type sugar transport system ATPase subunit
MPAYGLDGVSVSFLQGAQALRGVSMQAAARELVVILGGTGAGKTTLLRVLAGLRKPDSGRVLEDGADISMLPPHRRDMAMVFQNFSLYPRMTVGENLAFPLTAKVLGLSGTEISSRVKEAAAILALTDKLARRPDELSGGELQRVAIGRALVRRPKLFLMDEPLASLDAKLRERMVAEIRRLQRSLGCGMIYVTHDHEEAMSLADRIIVLEGGRILQSGTPEEIYRHPADSRVARMLGRPGINILTSEEAVRLGLPAEGRKLVGIRPESWRVTPDPMGPAIASVVEHLGPQIALVLDVQGVTLRVSVSPAMRVKPGDRFRLGMDAAELVYMDR